MSSTATADGFALTDGALDRIFREARTANTFTDEPVSTETLEAIYHLVKLGPTAANSQPLRLLFLTSDEAKARLLPHMSDGNRAKTGAAPVVAILGADGDFHEHMPEVFPHNPGAKDWFGGPEQRAETARFNGGIQLGYLIVAIRAAGLAAGPMNGFDHDAVDEEFFAGTAVKSFAVVNIGKPGPDAWFPRLPRRAYEDVVTVL
ncbi:MAG: malonic semialdehyde reductase [Aeromicrobium sp.]|uniref:malonic semialdehyde reductase n=1 Tax=Aeromicrobium sp. TaxID=1871063 RepID=UPI0039E3CE48